MDTITPKASVTSAQKVDELESTLKRASAQMVKRHKILKRAQKLAHSRPNSRKLRGLHFRIARLELQLLEVELRAAEEISDFFAVVASDRSLAKEVNPQTLATMNSYHRILSQRNAN